MPKITPMISGPGIETAPVTEILPDVVEEIIEKNISDPRKKSKSEMVEKALKAAGMDIKTLVNVHQTLLYSEDESVRLRALESAYSLHGIKNRDNAVDDKQIVFIVQGDNAQFNQILCPQRS